MESYVKVPVLELSQHHGILIHRQYWEYFYSFVVEHYMDTRKARIGVSNMWYTTCLVSKIHQRTL